MKLMGHSSGVVRVAGAVTLLAVSSAQAAIIFDNFDPGGGFHNQDNIVAAAVFELPPIFATRVAAQFMVTGGDFFLTSITLPISVQNLPPGNFLRVRLTADAAGQPGTTLELLSENQGIWPPFANPFTTTTTLTSATNPVLSDGAKYWIVMEPTSIPPGTGVHVDYRWFVNTTGSSVLFRQQQTQDELPSDPWPGPSFSFPAAFRVEGIGGNCPWDCDGGESTDGTVGIVDFLALLAQWGGPGSCDFDGGGVGITDFLALLGNWGPCLPGACCFGDFPNKSCTDAITALECAAAGGVYQGDDTTCDAAGCVDLCPGEGNCFEPNGTPGCNDAACCKAVCAVDQFCCNNQWDQLCANKAQELCGDAACPGAGGCAVPNGTPGCEDPVCCKTVCLVDPFCCNNQWDQLCADLAQELCDLS